MKVGRLIERITEVLQHDVRGARLVDHSGINELATLRVRRLNGVDRCLESKASGQDEPALGVDMCDVPGSHQYVGVVTDAVEDPVAARRASQVGGFGDRLSGEEDGGSGCHSGDHRGYKPDIRVDRGVESGRSSNSLVRHAGYACCGWSLRRRVASRGVQPRLSAAPPTVTVPMRPDAMKARSVLPAAQSQQVRIRPIAPVPLKA
ncbi:MAG TPA: hypothetical protein VJV76_05810 [Gaiellaceae bacterium]|nr:hypothetical protein [Gaiellaceae bacterium]